MTTKLGSRGLTDLIRSLEEGGRFHRDRWWGRIFHPGEISIRESQPDNSLHISIDGQRMMAHVDRVSPLKPGAGQGSRYSLLRIGAHNLSGMAGDLGRLLRGRQGDHRCELDCEWTEPSVQDQVEASGEPGPPWNVQLEVRVAGHLDEGRLRQAFVDALGGMPDPLSVVECADEVALDAARADLQGMALPLGAPPLRARLARSPGGDVVMTNFHRAVVDGFAALGVLISVARYYAGEDPPPPPLDLLALHDIPVRPSTAEGTKVVWLYRGVIEKVRNRLTPPALLAPDSTGDEPGFGYHLVNLAQEDTSALVHFSHSGTSTDVLLAALHLAIGAWNADHGRPGGRVSVLVSANLRSPRLREDAMGNFSVTARVSTGRRDRSNAAKALKMVTAQTSRNRRSRTGTALLEALDRSGLLALWAKQSAVVLRPVTGNRDVDTAMLCNLGRLAAPPTFGAEAGETLEVWFSPPTRIPIGLSIGAATVSGRMHLVFRYPHRLFDGDAARRFAECYVDQLRVAGR
ncbi:MAG TPA: hypothetical protein VGV93_14110 [Acidimicrobiales bacterium]|nr:hypothetical protein [Acidimicrobiales bacterium]